MSFNTKNRTVKRILQEAAELAASPSPDYHAEPREDNLFEWHFTVRGPPAPAPYAGGLYHGRVLLPASYPLRPPSFRFLTPSGRFEVNREICLSISGHHEESWQPAWGLRTALVAIRAFMASEPDGQVGGLDCSEPARRRMAAESGRWACGDCRRTNANLLPLWTSGPLNSLSGAASGSSSGTASVTASGTASGSSSGTASGTASGSASNGIRLGSVQNKSKQDPAVPAALRLAYRDELASPADRRPDKDPAGPPVDRHPPTNPQVTTLPPLDAAPSTVTPTPTPTPTTPSQDTLLPWLDKAILGVFATLVIMLLRKILTAWLSADA